MIRFLLLLLIAVVFIIYFVLILVRGFLRTLQRPPRSSSGNPRQETPQKPKEEYKDVQDAKFVELSDKKKEEGS
ncbi:MAG: hypothetical protein JXA06_06305 [Bacteroidetes bacterium]|nr:hypothetical protein [Bacteroidota bacterium]